MVVLGDDRPIVGQRHRSRLWSWIRCCCLKIRSISTKLSVVGLSMAADASSSRRKGLLCNAGAGAAAGKSVFYFGVSLSSMIMMLKF